MGSLNNGLEIRLIEAWHTTYSRRQNNIGSSLNEVADRF